MVDLSTTRPDPESTRDSGARDEDQLTGAERFDQLRAFFLDKLREHGYPRKELYQELRWGAQGYFSEEQLVRQWAEKLDAPLRFIFQGIEACYENAAAKRIQITSFRFVIPWIIQRVRKGTPL